MADTAAQQLKRVLAIIPKFADDEEHPLVEIAALLDTTVAQLVKDIASVAERFDVAGFVESVRIHISADTASMTASEFHRPMRLTMPELCALELGLAMLRLERTPTEQQAIDKAIERLREAITRLPANEAHEGLRDANLLGAANLEHLALLRAAARNNRKVRISYRAGGATESTTREFNPYAVVYAEQMWYAVTVGSDDALRHYRLDRIEEAEMLDDTFEPDESVSERLSLAGRAFASSTDRRMTVRYSPRIARWVAERAGASLADDGSLTLEHPVADDAWAVRHVLQYGPEAEVLGPPEMREIVANRLRAMAER